MLSFDTTISEVRQKKTTKYGDKTFIYGRLQVVDKSLAKHNGREVTIYVVPRGVKVKVVG